MQLQFDKATIAQILASHTSTATQTFKRFDEFVFVSFGSGPPPAGTEHPTGSPYDFFGYQPGYAAAVVPVEGAGLQVSFALFDSNLTVLSVQGEGSGLSTPNPLGLLVIDDIAAKAHDGKVVFCPTSVLGVLIEKAQQAAIAAGLEVEYSIESLSIIPSPHLISALEGPPPSRDELCSWNESPLMLNIAAAIWPQLLTLVGFQETGDSALFPARLGSLAETAEFRERFPDFKKGIENSHILGGALARPVEGPPQGPPAAQQAAGAPLGNPASDVITQKLAEAQLALAQTKQDEIAAREDLKTYGKPRQAAQLLLLGSSTTSSPFFASAFAAKEVKASKAELIFLQFATLRIADQLRTGWPRSCAPVTPPPPFASGAEAGVFTPAMLLPIRADICTCVSRFIENMIPLILISEFFFGVGNPFAVWLQTIIVAAHNTRCLPASMIVELDAGAFWENLLVEIYLELESAYRQALAVINGSTTGGLSSALSLVLRSPGASYEDVFLARQTEMGMPVASTISLFLWHDSVKTDPESFRLAAPWKTMVGPPLRSTPPPAPHARSTGRPAAPLSSPSSAPSKEVQAISPWGAIGTFDAASVKAGKLAHSLEAKAAGHSPPWSCVKYLALGACDNQQCSFHHHSPVDLPTDKIILAYLCEGATAKKAVQAMHRLHAASASVLAPVCPTPPCSAPRCKKCTGA
ncbi:hypothetical protein TrRE_jg2622 [Triparma retinervis]|uniref:Uncharacterized protein n=1 Tax=Triparma retinervis TaxID=2557542 RepID=A0A9W7FYA8_9STRA|nr:hypothetical protein TrRE_jg2622 [Triparma retinervis]